MKTTSKHLIFSHFLLLAILSFFAFPSSRFGGVDASSVRVSKFLRRGGSKNIPQKSSLTAPFSLKSWEGTEEYARAEKQARLLVERVVASSSPPPTSASKKNNNKRESKAAATIATHSNACVAVREQQLCNATGTTQDACDALTQCTWNTWPTDSCTNEQADNVRFAIDLGYGFGLLVPVLTCGFATMGGESTCNDVDMGCTWKAADSTCEFDLTNESMLTTLFGDSFLSKLMSQNALCGQYASEDLCTADSSCAWDDYFSSCESRDDLDTSLYSSYCDENTKTQAQNTDFCDVLDSQKTCSAATSDNTCLANSECMYGDEDGCSINFPETFKLLGLSLGARLDSYVDVLTCADVESEAECTSISTCEVWNSIGEPSCVPTDAAFDAALPSNPFLADMTKNELLCDKYDSETSCQSDSMCAWDCEDSTCGANPNMVEATCAGLTKPYVSEEDLVPDCSAESDLFVGSAAAKGSLKIVCSAVVLAVTALSGLLL
jgi:hypothetical protein